MKTTRFPPENADLRFRPRGVSPMKKQLPLILASGLILALGALVIPHKRNPYSSRPDDRGVQATARLYDLFGNDLGEESFGALGGSPSYAWNAGSNLRVIEKGLYEVTLNTTGTDWAETFLLGVPPGPLRIAPLLVLFHGYGERPEDLLLKTRYFELARERGWYVVAPLSAHEYNFGLEYAQRNTELALNWVAKVIPLDVKRIYGIGFSMGGGVVASYAARHQDLYGGRFAAIVNHSGVTSLSHTFRMSSDNRLFLSPLMFGETPDQNPFAYSAVSSYDLDPVTSLIDPNTDMLRNLVGTPVRTFAALSDPNQHVVNQTTHFESQFAFRGGSGDALRSTANIHAWSTMNEVTTLDWLQGHVLRAPAPNKTHHLLADRTQRWHGFYLHQRQAGLFTPLIYHVDLANNRLHTIGTENLKRIALYAPSLGLATNDTFEWSFGNADGQEVELVLRGVTHLPIDVERNGSSTIEWEYDSQKRELILREPNAASVPLWRVYF